MIIDILKKIGILFGLLIVVFIAISILITIYTYFNMRLRTGNIFEGFSNVNSHNDDISFKVNQIIKNQNCYSKTKNPNNIKNNNSCIITSKNPFIGILQTDYNNDNTSC